MKSKAEQIYEAIGEGYGYNGSKEHCIKIIENIINSDTPESKNLIKPDVKFQLPSDDEMKETAKKWAEHFEGIERLGMESAHYCGQVYIRNRMIILGVPNGA